MRIDYKYLKTFLQAKESIEDLADLMTSIGFESEINHDNSIEFDVTPNRGDFLSLKGISREYSAEYSLEIPLSDKKSPLLGVTSNSMELSWLISLSKPIDVIKSARSSMLSLACKKVFRYL